MSGPTAYPSLDEVGRFLLKPGRWYGWQMLPGYSSGYSPYCSPIRIERVVPKKSGAGWLDVEFYNAFYAAGVKALLYPFGCSCVAGSTWSRRSMGSTRTQGWPLSTAFPSIGSPHSAPGSLRNILMNEWTVSPKARWTIT